MHEARSKADYISHAKPGHPRETRRPLGWLTRLARTRGLPHREQPCLGCRPPGLDPGLRHSRPLPLRDSNAQERGLFKNPSIQGPKPGQQKVRLPPLDKSRGFRRERPMNLGSDAKELEIVGVFGDLLRKVRV